jgi:hypothetical protein
MRIPASATAVLWFAPVVLQPLIACALLGRRLVRAFPIFFCFNILVPARDTALFFLPYPGNAYSSVYWWGEGGAVLLALGVVFETTSHFIRPYPFLRVFLKVLWISGVIAGALALVLLWAAGPSGASLVFEWIVSLERSARFLQVCLLIVAIALMSRLGLTWRHYSLGIAAGFGVYSALDLLLLELRAHLHALSDTAFVLLRPAAYNLGVAIWAFYFLWPQVGKPVDRLPGNDLANWNDALTRQIKKWFRRS